MARDWRHIVHHALAAINEFYAPTAVPENEFIELEGFVIDPLGRLVKPKGLKVINPLKLIDCDSVNYTESTCKEAGGTWIPAAVAGTACCARGVTGISEWTAGWREFVTAGNTTGSPSGPGYGCCEHPDNTCTGDTTETECIESEKGAAYWHENYECTVMGCVSTSSTTSTSSTSSTSTATSSSTSTSTSTTALALPWGLDFEDDTDWDSTITETGGASAERTDADASEGTYSSKLDQSVDGIIIVAGPLFVPSDTCHLRCHLNLAGELAGATSQSKIIEFHTAEDYILGGMNFTIFPDGFAIQGQVQLYETGEGTGTTCGEVTVGTVGADAWVQLDIFIDGSQGVGSNIAKVWIDTVLGASKVDLGGLPTIDGIRAWCGHYINARNCSYYIDGIEAWATEHDPS